VHSSFPCGVSCSGVGKMGKEEFHPVGFFRRFTLNQDLPFLRKPELMGVF
jgi:hypothetical protein